MEFLYKFEKNEHGEIEYCHTCKCEALVCEFDNPDLRKRKDEPKILLCEICSGTHVGSEIRLNHEFLSPLAFAQAMNLLIIKLYKLSHVGDVPEE